MHWILSSSGARPLYLENIVRALALPEGELIQYRYEAAIVSDNFKARVRENGAGKDIAYLCYLDNRDKGKIPRLFPVREAVIQTAFTRGSSYIVQLRVKRFVNWECGEDLSEEIKKLAKEELPNWKPGEKPPYVGFWAAETESFDNRLLVEYDRDDKKHVDAFESTVRACCEGADFIRGDYLFANIVGIREISSGKFVKSGILCAGRAYELIIYHYLPRTDPHFVWKPFWIELRSETDSVKCLAPLPHKSEAEYDEVRFPFRIDEGAFDKEVSLNLSILRNPSQPEQSSVLLARVMFELRPALWLHLFNFAGVIVGIAGAQFVTLYSADKLDLMSSLAILLFSFIAAASIVWKGRNFIRWVKTQLSG